MNIHFHTLAEHLIDEKRHSIEMHMVHSLNKGFENHTNRSKLVIGVLFNFDGKGKTACE